MAKKSNMLPVCLISMFVVLFGTLMYFLCRCKFTEKYIDQRVSSETSSKIIKFIQLSSKPSNITKFPQSNIFNDKVLNNKTILVQKVFEMLNGRVDRLVKLGEKYPNVKPSDKIKPQEIQVEIDKIRRIMKKIPIFQKHDYTKVFTRGIDPKSKEYTSLYYLGMKANDQVYKTNLCSKDKQCMKVIDRLNDVSKKRGDIIKNVVEQYLILKRQVIRIVVTGIMHLLMVIFVVQQRM
jgi:hypothetical protein